MEVFQKVKHKIIPRKPWIYFWYQKKTEYFQASFSNFASRFETSNFRNKKTVYIENKSISGLISTFLVQTDKFHINRARMNEDRR